MDIGAEIFDSLRELEKLKGIPVDYMVERLKQALINAYRRDREDHRDLPADRGINLRQQRRRQLHKMHAAQVRRRRQPRQIANHPAAQRDDGILARQMMFAEEGIQRFQRFQALRLLAVRQDDAAHAQPDLFHRRHDFFHIQRRNMVIADNRDRNVAELLANHFARFRQQSAFDMNRIASFAQRYGNGLHENRLPYFKASIISSNMIP